MHMIIRILLLSVLFTRCSTSKPLPVSAYQIHQLAAFYHGDSSQINFGNPFPFFLYAQMKNGEIIQLAEKDNVRVSANLQVNLTSEVAIINHKPTSFKEDKVPFKIEVGYVGNTIRVLMDTLTINFKNDVIMDDRKIENINGPNGTQARINVLSRHGNSGGDGQTGFDGLNGDSYDVYIWKENTRTYIVCTNKTSNISYKYQVEGDHNIFLDASGENGGHGGVGAAGGSGNSGENDEVSNRLPGNGGHGGNGGNGGHGGDGGEIMCYIHPNARDRVDYLKFTAAGGKAGKGGAGGRGGAGGSPASGQYHGTTGVNGSPGNDGNPGKEGHIEKTIVPFNYEMFK